jgi:hypothetical protein
MIKDSLYFSHDYDCRQDPKIKRLLTRHGAAGYGVFWGIVETLYQQGGYYSVDDSDCIANDLNSDVKLVISIVNDFGLFKKKGKLFFSDSVLRRLKLREEKSLKAKKSASKRWENMQTHTERNANAMHTQSDGNANKEIKQIKENNDNKNALPEGALWNGSTHRNQTN